MIHSMQTTIKKLNQLAEKAETKDIKDSIIASRQWLEDALEYQCAYEGVSEDDCLDGEKESNELRAWHHGRVL